MRFRPRGRARPVRATCSLGRVAFWGARGRGEFERVAAAHEDLSVCVLMCSRQPPGELAWGRAPRRRGGARNALPQPWKLRLDQRISGKSVRARPVTTRAPRGPGRRFETMQAGVASRSWASDVADRRRGRGTRTSRRQRRVAVRAAQTGTRDDSGDVTARDAWADLGPAGHRRGTNRIAETSAATAAVPAVDAPKSGFKVDPITAAAGGTALAAAGVVAAATGSLASRSDGRKLSRQHAVRKHAAFAHALARCSERQPLPVLG